MFRECHPDWAGKSAGETGVSASAAVAVAVATASATTGSAQTGTDLNTELSSPALLVAAKVSASVVNVRVTGVTAGSVYGEQEYEIAESSDLDVAPRPR